jgi:hypothetical protein
MGADSIAINYLNTKATTAISAGFAITGIAVTVRKKGLR